MAGNHDMDELEQLIQELEQQEKILEAPSSEGSNGSGAKSLFREGSNGSGAKSLFREGSKSSGSKPSFGENSKETGAKSSSRDDGKEAGPKPPYKDRDKEAGTKGASEEDGGGQAQRRKEPVWKKQKKRQKGPLMHIAAAAVFVTVVILIALGSAVIKKYSPTKERADLRAYYHIQNEDDMAIVLDGQILEETAKYWDGHVYLDYKTVQEYLNQRFYWDSNENLLRYTTASELISVDAGSRDYEVSRKKQSEEYVIVKVDGEQMYLALDFVQKYTNLDFETHEMPNRVRITASWGSVQTAEARKNTELRVLGGIKSPIVADIEKGGRLTILERGENWSRAYTGDGMIGYVKNSGLGEITEETVSRDFEEEEFTHLLKEGRVSMGWHQVTNPEANERVGNVLQSTKGINVLSPTWFYLNDNEGNIYSLASKEYVDYCHQNDVEVWALCSNLENADADSTYVLTHSSVRDHLTNQIIAAAIEYNLDGINLDFEALSGEVGDAYIQFVRELSLKCKNNSLVLSVDNYVPSSYTAFYNRAEQSVFADYVVIMGYDEYTRDSENIGPVASLPFVQKGVADTLAEVPAEQVILGMPFYSRVWELTPKEDSGEDVASAAEGYIPYTFTCTEEGMQTVEDRYLSYGAKASWSAEAGQDVVEYESPEEGKNYKIWIENEKSLEEKLKVMRENGLAGAAYWKLGLERESAWETIIKYVN